MQRITSSKLAELLQKGFEGEVRFSGRVYCCLEHVMSSTHTLYENSGEFSLTPVGRDEGKEEGSYLLRNGESDFYFKPEKRESINPEGRADLSAISFPIEVPSNASLRIEPKKIIF